MNVRRIRSVAGPSIFHNRPVLVMTIDLEKYADVSSLDVEGFVPRLLDVLPGLRTHHCSPGRPGGFVERLERGTYFAHIIEHVALELSEPVGIPVSYGKSVYAGEGHGVYNVVVRSKNDPAMTEVLRTAVELVRCVAEDRSFPLEQHIAEAARLFRRTKLGPSTQALVDAADARGIPWTRLNEGSLVQLGTGVFSKKIQAALTSETSAIAMETASDKALTKQLLAAAQIPVPDGDVVSNEEEAIAAFRRLGGTAVVKPLDGNHGRGVTLGVTTVERLRAAYAHAAMHAGSVIVEEMFRGNDFRALVVGGKLVAMAERLPAHVIGDGVRTVSQLIREANADPRRGEGHEKPLTRIDVAAAEVFLQFQEKSLETIPAKGERVFLNETANLSTGGTATDVTSRVHPAVQELCERSARVIGLDICGIDLQLDDVAMAPTRGHNGVIEVNAGPGLRMHLHPSHGNRQEVGKAIIDMLYPAGTPARIPVTSVTGTNGKTTVTRLIAHTLSLAGKRVGMTTTGGIAIGDRMIATGDTTGPASARTVLFDNSVEVAVLETARGGIVRRGLGYDWSDIGVVTNIQPDHIGQDGIEDIDDIIRIKSLVPERVRPGGIIVLNADCPNVSRMMEASHLMRPDRRRVYFSLNPSNPLVLRHVAAGGTAYVIREERIVEWEGLKETAFGSVEAVPITFRGTADFQIANVLAAVAACRAQGVSVDTVTRALRSFGVSGENAGRANAFRVGHGYVMVDYGHNPEAFRAICQMTAKWSGHSVTGVVGLPGDRADSVLEEAGRVIAGGFDRVILREDADLRGRLPGEALAILRRSIESASPGIPCRIAPSERQAVLTALETMEPGEVVVVFYDDDVEHVLEVLRIFRAEPISEIPELRRWAAPRAERAVQAWSR